MARVCAHYTKAALAADHLALSATYFDRCFDFHSRMIDQLNSVITELCLHTTNDSALSSGRVDLDTNTVTDQHLNTVMSHLAFQISQNQLTRFLQFYTKKDIRQCLLNGTEHLWDFCILH